MVGSVLFTFILVEVAARIYLRDASFGKRLSDASNLLHSAYPAAFDPTLGWIPKAGFSGKQNVWGTEVTILPTALRSNGNAAPDLPVHPSVVTVGDSFTFGDEVSDQETWPAALEASAKVKVYNGGVFGYAVDQAALRASRLRTQFSPDMIIFAVTPDDIIQTQLSERTGIKKPFYSVTSGGGLKLEGVPVPSPDEYRASQFENFLKEQSSRSVLINKLMLRVFPEWWLYGRWSEKLEQTNPDIVSCSVIASEAAKSLTANEAFMVLVQYPKEWLDDAQQVQRIGRLETCLSGHNIPILDMREPLKHEQMCSPDDFAKFYSPIRGHMTKLGNAFTASLLLPAVEAPRQAGQQSGILQYAVKASHIPLDSCSVTQAPLKNTH